jgi:hypothetical protein
MKPIISKTRVVGCSLLLVPLLLALAGEAPFYQDKNDLLYYLDVSGTRHSVVTRGDWEKRRQHVLANMQIVMGPLPQGDRVPLDLKVLEEVQTE